MPSQTWTVRQAEVSDADAIAALSQSDATAESVGAVRHRVTAVLTNPSRHVVVAVSGTRVVGMAEAQFLGVSIRRPFGSAQLHDLFVAPDWRRRGIGTALFRAVRDWAAGLDSCRYLEWDSAPTGLPLYASMGLVAVTEHGPHGQPFFELEV